MPSTPFSTPCHHSCVWSLVSSREGSLMTRRSCTYLVRVVGEGDHVARLEGELLLVLPVEVVQRRRCVALASLCKKEGGQG